MKTHFLAVSSSLTDAAFFGSTFKFSEELSVTLCGRDKIIESSRLEETSMIIKSNHQPNTTVATKPCPEVPQLNVF